MSACRTQADQLHHRPRRHVEGPTHLRELLRDRPHAVRLHADASARCCRSPRTRSARSKPATEHVVRAPVRAQHRAPAPDACPTLVAALQEQMRGMPPMPARRGPCTDSRGALLHPPRATGRSSTKLDGAASQTPTPSCTTAPPFELLVATILSAQSTDERVNIVTPALFAKYPDARALAAADPARRRTARSCRPGSSGRRPRRSSACPRALVERHDGEVPADMDALVQLPGVGRKTANVVLGHALGVPGPAGRSPRAPRVATASASPRATIPKSSRRSSARRCRASGGRARPTR